jgi:uncharacterized membrane protein
MSATTSTNPWGARPARAAPFAFRFGTVTSIEADDTGDASMWAEHSSADAGASNARQARLVSVEWLLKRNCSMAPNQLLLFFVSLCVLSFAIAGVFWAQGARLVLPFTALEIAALAVALLVYGRHAGDRESIALSSGRLKVSHVNGRRVEVAEFDAAWLRVEPEHGDRSLIELSGQGQRIWVGRFVRPELRRQLADELRMAVRRWQAQPRMPLGVARGT